MAAIDASKPVAKALELIREFLHGSNDDPEGKYFLLVEATSKLEVAIEKLCEEQK